MFNSFGYKNITRRSSVDNSKLCISELNFQSESYPTWYSPKVCSIYPQTEPLTILFIYRHLRCMWILNWGIRFCKTNKSNSSSSQNLKYYSNNVKDNQIDIVEAIRVKVWWQTNLYLGNTILRVTEIHFKIISDTSHRFILPISQ